MCFSLLAAFPVLLPDLYPSQFSAVILSWLGGGLFFVIHSFFPKNPGEGYNFRTTRFAVFLGGLVFFGWTFLLSAPGLRRAFDRRPRWRRDEPTVGATS